MSIALNSPIVSAAQTQQPIQFKHLIAVTPLGFLYGSAGRFLSPDHLVGRSGSHFPPDASAISGLFMAAHQKDLKLRKQLHIAGPFWAKQDKITNFYLPTPFSHLIQNGFLKYRMTWKQDQWMVWSNTEQAWIQPPDRKFEENTWIAINDFIKISKSAENICPEVFVRRDPPWKRTAHLHPELAHEERCTVNGRLFLENAVQMDPDYCLVYLSTHPLQTEEETKTLQTEWYRFGGEGHMVEISRHDLPPDIEEFLNHSLGHEFALITPAVWGSNRFSERYPQDWGASVQLLTQRPVHFRYRLGKKLSRGRYAVPSGTVYHCQEEKPPWKSWDLDWFPQEGISLQQLGCGLALPLQPVSAQL
jgi:CRISPR-associated protein Cmr3